MVEKAKEAKLVFLGLSSDCRTNRWRVYCKCGYAFEPSTTMLAKQTVMCPKCHSEYLADYNHQPEAKLNLFKS